MISINNRALPVPGEMELSLREPAAGGYPKLLRLRAAWRGLGAEGLAGILRDTAQGFTLACPDPRTGQERGFTARLSECRATALGGGLYRLDTVMDETEG